MLFKGVRFVCCTALILNADAYPSRRVDNVQPEEYLSKKFASPIPINHKRSFQNTTTEPIIPSTSKPLAVPISIESSTIERESTLVSQSNPSPSTPLIVPSTSTSQHASSTALNEGISPTSRSEQKTSPSIATPASSAAPDLGPSSTVIVSSRPPSLVSPQTNHQETSLSSPVISSQPATSNQGGSSFFSVIITSETSRLGADPSTLQSRPSTSEQLSTLSRPAPLLPSIPLPAVSISVGLSIGLPLFPGLPTSTNGPVSTSQAISASSSASPPSQSISQTTSYMVSSTLDERPSTLPVPTSKATSDGLAATTTIVSVISSSQEAISQSTPVTISQNTPASVSQNTPASVSQSTPAIFSQSTPAIVSQSTPAIVSQSTPAAVGSSTPVAVSQSTPAAVSQSTPAAVSQSTSVAVSQSTPVAFSESTPVIISQSTPIAPVGSSTLASSPITSLAPVASSSRAAISESATIISEGPSSQAASSQTQGYSTTSIFASSPLRTSSGTTDEVSTISGATIIVSSGSVPTALSSQVATPSYSPLSTGIISVALSSSTLDSSPSNVVTTSMASIIASASSLMESAVISASISRPTTITIGSYTTGVPTSLSQVRALSSSDLSRNSEASNLKSSHSTSDGQIAPSSSISNSPSALSADRTTLVSSAIISSRPSSFTDFASRLTVVESSFNTSTATALESRPTTTSPGVIPTSISKTSSSTVEPNPTSSSSHVSGITSAHTISESKSKVGGDSTLPSFIPASEFTSPIISSTPSPIASFTPSPIASSTPLPSWNTTTNAASSDGPSIANISTQFQDSSVNSHSTGTKTDLSSTVSQSMIGTSMITSITGMATVPSGISRSSVASSSSVTPTSTAAAASPPPLTSSQTVGVAIAGTTGLLLAIVAAVFVARRYHAKHARRGSKDSIYPKVAYLYDPTVGGGERGDGGDSTEPFMSGGSNGMPQRNSTSSLPQTPRYNPRYSESVYTRFSDTSNPFDDPEEPIRYSEDGPNSTTAHSAGLAAISHGNTYTQVPQNQQPQRTSVIASRNLGPAATTPRPESRYSTLSEITSMAYSPLPRSNANSQYRPFSQSRRHTSMSIPSMMKTSYVESFHDPFEHDLLLQVDTRTETPDAATLFAPPPASPRMAARPLTPIREPVKGLSPISVANPTVAQYMMRSESNLLVRTGSLKRPAVSPSVYHENIPDDWSSVTFVSPTRTQHNEHLSPFSTPPPPIHRGWDDIKRYSDDRLVPLPLKASASMTNLSAPKPSFSPISPIPRERTFAPLHRKESTIASSVQAMRSYTRLPIRMPFANKRASVSADPKSNLATKKSAEDVKSPELSMPKTFHSITSRMHRKKSEDLTFACAGI